MSYQKSQGEAIEVQVEITQLPTSGLPTPAPEQLPLDLADTGADPCILLIAVAVFALGAFATRFSRRKRMTGS
ncbi:hypothetical protein ACTXOJ_09880 [Glutamicibacter arilaitensis]|uniref:hypothetical protein n=1 Tax=Glutamicibacter arilaitensis TaxID=256701 RepID=UPI003FD085D7